MAYPKTRSRHASCYSGYVSHIIIYNSTLNKIENKIYNAHETSNGFIQNIKHYFNPYTKKHILFSSDNNKIRLWNISSIPIINILSIYCGRDNSYPVLACLLFKNEKFFTFGGYCNGKLQVWDEKGKSLADISKSKINRDRTFIEATYFENKNYILLSGYDTNLKYYYSECYNYDENDEINKFYLF